VIAGSLEIQLLANIARLQADMNQAKQVVGGAMSSIERAAAVAKGALIGLGAVGLAAAFASSIKGAIDLADNLNKLSQRTGVAVESLSQLQYAAKLADVSNESLTTGFKKLNVSIAAGLAGDKEKLATFRELGITLKDVTGKTKTADTVLLEIADAFAKARDGAGKTAIAVNLLGKAGDEMIPLLNGGAEAIRNLMREADRLGLTIGTDFAAQAEEFNDNLARVQTQTQKTAILFAGDFVAGLGKAMKAMADATIESGKLAGAIAFLQTFLTGTDLYKANVELTKATQNWMAAELALQNAQAAGDAKRVERLQNTVRLRKEEMDTAKRAQGFFAAEEAAAEDAAAKVAKVRATGRELRGPGGAGPAAVAESAYEKLIDRIQERMLLGDQELLLGRELTEAEKFAAKVWADAAASKKPLTEEEAKTLAIRLDIIDTNDEMLAVRKSELQQAKDIAAERQKIREADLVATAAGERAIREANAAAEKDARDALKAAQAEYDQHGLLKSQVTELHLAEMLRRQDNLLAGSEAYESLAKQIEATRALIDLQRRGEVRDAAEKSAKDAIAEWNRYADQIGQSLADQLMEGGRSGAEYIKNLFRTMVLQPIIKGVVTDSMQAVGLAPQGTGLAGSLSNASTLGNAYGAASQFLTGGAAGASAASLGYANMVGAVGGDALGALIAANGSWAGVSAGAGAAAAGAGAGLGATAAAAIPYIGWAIAAIGIISAFMGEGGGPKTIGGADISSTINQQYGAFAAQLGLKTNFRAGAYSAVDTEGDALTQLQVASFLGDRAVYSREDRLGGFENVGRSQEELQAAIAEEIIRSIYAAMLEEPELKPEYRDLLALGGATPAEMQKSIDLLMQRKAIEDQIYEVSATDAQKIAKAREVQLAATDESLHGVLLQLYAAQDLKKAADEAVTAVEEVAEALVDLKGPALAGLDRAFGTLSAAVEAERKALAKQVDASNKSITKLQGLLGSLDGYLGNVNTSGPIAMGAASARAQILAAVAIARAGGPLPEAAAVQDALTVLGQVNEDSYVTAQDMALDVARNAQAARDLKAIAGSQLTTEQQTLQAMQDQGERLDGILTAARAQIDAINGNTTVLMGLPAALENFTRLATHATWAANPTTPSGVSVQDVRDFAAGLPPTFESEMAIYNAARENGVSSGFLESALGWAPGTVAAWVEQNGLTPFADGVNFVPQDMPAFLHAGEEVRPAAYVRQDQQDMGAIVERLDRLTSVVDNFRAESVSAGRRTADNTKASLDLLDSVTEGGTALYVATPEGEPLETTT